MHISQSSPQPSVVYRQQPHDASVRAVPAKAWSDLPPIPGSRGALGTRAARSGGTLPRCYEWILALFRQCLNGWKARAWLADAGRPPTNDACLSI
jgi:hypothetical protein